MPNRELLRAIDSNNVAAVQTILKRRLLSKINLQKYDYLGYAIQSASADIIRLLIANGSPYGAALPIAIQNRRADVVDILLSIGVRPTGADLVLALHEGADASALLSSINDRDSHGNTPLMAAVNSMGASAVRFLLDHGADITATNQNGETALFYATDPAIVGLLVTAGADVNAVNNDGANVLNAQLSDNWMTPRKILRLPVVTALVTAGMDINNRDRNGVSLLMKAAMTQTATVCTALLGLGAAVNAINNTGESALFYAYDRENWPAFKALVVGGADLDLLTDSGTSILYIAALYRNMAVVRYLLAAGASVTVVLPTIRMSVLDAAVAGEFSREINALIKHHHSPNAALAQTHVIPVTSVNRLSAAITTTSAIIFKVGPSAVIEVPLDELREGIADKSGVIYECSRGGERAPITLDEPFYLLRDEYMIPMSQMQRLIAMQRLITKPGNRIFELIDTGIVREFTAKYGTVYGGVGNCPLGSARRIYTLRELINASQYGGMKMRARKTIRHHK